MNVAPDDLKRLPRLDGDALYEWTRLTYEEELFFARKQVQAEKHLQERGYTPGEYLLSNDGYIISRDQNEQRLHQQEQADRARVVPSKASPSPVPLRADSGNQAQDRHRAENKES